MSTTTRRVAFRSKPLSRRSTPAKHKDTLPWQPAGPFRFFDLPAELRVAVIKVAVVEARTGHSVGNLLLVCKQVHSEVASVAHKDTIVDLTRSSGTITDLATALSTSASTEISLWRHVNRLVIRLYLVDHLHMLSSAFGPALQDMTHQHKLKSLCLEIGSKFPSDDFWGDIVNNGNSGDAADEHDVAVGSAERSISRSNLWQSRNLITGSRRAKAGTGVEIHAPLFVATPSFQNFLRFLYLSKIPEISLNVDANDHQQFWCPFHEKRNKGIIRDFSTVHCYGIPAGAFYVQIDWKDLVRTFGGARVPSH